MQVIPQGTYAAALAAHGVGAGTDSAVRTGIMQVIEQLCAAATHKPAGPALAADKSTGSSPKTAKVLADVQKLYAAQGPGSISVTVLGETHGYPQDQARADTLIAAVAAGTLASTLLLFERGMTYAVAGVPCPIARETNLTTIAAGDFGLGLSPAQRSMVLAGYVYLCLAGGPQNGVDSVLLFCGERHSDILTHFEYFVQHTTSNWTQNRARTLLLIRSHH